jgi:hypothetical protein
MKTTKNIVSQTRRVYKTRERYHYEETMLYALKRYRKFFCESVVELDIDIIEAHIHDVELMEKDQIVVRFEQYGKQHQSYFEYTHTNYLELINRAVCNIVDREIQEAPKEKVLRPRKKNDYTVVRSRFGTKWGKLNG